MSKTYLVTGGCGFIGSQVIEELLKDKNISVAHYDMRFAKPIDDRSTMGISLIRFAVDDILDTTQLIDDQGNIMSDALLGVTEISFDEIDCTQIVQDISVYRHNLNGNGPEIEDQFFGDLGCNGSVEFKFTTPIYLWLLESM